MSGELDIFLKTRDQLNKVSNSFCLAKWMQVTLHLQNGRTHSCHHPGTHEIPLEELRNDPSALHNTQFKMQQRKMMIDGIRPSECQYCWNVEDLGHDFISDRYIKSASDWAIDNVENIEALPWDKPINPKYVEISFSNVCNFKCSYCSPVHSSRWAEESEKYGPYPTGGNFNDINYMKSSGQMPIHHREFNPYVHAFWQWWPDLIKDLKVIRVTGGEPLLDDNTFKLMDKLIDEGTHGLQEIAINSNACVPKKKIDEFIKKMSVLEEKPGIITRLFTSVDAHGAQAEYGRNGLDYDTWFKNIDRILTELPKTKVTIMCTGNIFSITSFKKLLEDIYALKQKHFSKERKVPITIDISILRWPAHQCTAILPNNYAGDFLQESLDYMKSKKEGVNGNPYYIGFYEFEIAKLERFIEFTSKDPNPDEGIRLSSSRQDFVKFVDEHDRRRGTNFLKTFPELEEFYRLCSKTIPLDIK